MSTIADVIAGRASWAVECRDGFALARELGVGAVDHVIGDPPYDEHTHENARTTDANGKAIDAAIDFAPIPPTETFVPALVACARRWVICFCALEQLGDYKRAGADTFIRSGLWVRTNGLPQRSGDRPAQGGEGSAVSAVVDRTAIVHAIALVADGTLCVDADGRVWRARSHGRVVERRRAENVGGKGYLRLTLQLPGGNLGQVMAHRLVWEAANGPIPPGMQINHKDLDKTNNRLANLEVVDGSGNIRHSYANGRRRPWSDADEWRGKARVSEDVKALIREARGGGAKLKDIAARFGVSVSHAHRITTEKHHADR